MNLSEFLLARIDEDEAALAQYEQAWSQAPRTPDPVYRHWELGVDNEYAAIHIDPTRVRDECRAKRALIEAHAREWHTPHRDLSPMNRYINKGRVGGLWIALQHAAMPYSAHPDYDEKWKP